MPANAFFLGLEAIGIPETTGLVSQVEREAKQELRGRLKQAAGLVADEAKRRSHSRRVAAATSYSVEVKSSEEFRAVIGPLQKKAFFAHFLEFGTRASTRHPFTTRAFPTFGPALEATEDAVVDLVGIPPILGGGR